MNPVTIQKGLAQKNEYNKGNSAKDRLMQNLDLA